MSFIFRHKPPPAPDPFDPQRELERCCERLKQHYQEWAPLDVSGGSAIRNMAQLQRLFRAVRTEHFVGE